MTKFEIFCKANSLVFSPFMQIYTKPNFTSQIQISQKKVNKVLNVVVAWNWILLNKVSMLLREKNKKSCCIALDK